MVSGIIRSKVEKSVKIIEDRWRELFPKHMGHPPGITGTHLQLYDCNCESSTMRGSLEFTNLWSINSLEKVVYEPNSSNAAQCPLKHKGYIHWCKRRSKG